jgi:hypothetical protein
MLIRKLDKRTDGQQLYTREPWDRVSIPGVGECLEQVDWTGNLTVYATDKEYTGVEIIEKTIPALAGHLVGGDAGIPKSS